MAKDAYRKNYDFGVSFRKRDRQEIELMNALIDLPSSGSITDAQWDAMCTEKCGAIAGDKGVSHETENMD